MDEVFVDTAAWIALLDEADSLHRKATEVLERLSANKSRLVTTEFVLLELGDGFSSIDKREKGLKFVEELRGVEILRIVPATQELLTQGWELYRKRLDKNWQVTDCVSFIVMKENGISIAFTSDRHFEQAGFVKLM